MIIKGLIQSMRMILLIMIMITLIIMIILIIVIIVILMIITSMAIMDKIMIMIIWPTWGATRKRHARVMEGDRCVYAGGGGG